MNLSNSNMNKYCRKNISFFVNIEKTRRKKLPIIVAFILFVGTVLPVPAVANENKEDRNFPPHELIKDNVETTDVTAAIEVIDIKQEQVIKSDSGEPGYIIFRINGKVFRCYKGNLKQGDEIEYHWWLEAGVKPPIKGTKYIASFNKKKEYFLIPDVAYHFKYSEGLHKLFEKAVNEVYDSSSKGRGDKGIH